MCGRFVRSTDKDDLQSRFGFTDPQGVLLEPRYNIAPSQMHPVVIVEDDQRVLKLTRWSLVPFWAKNTNIGYKMINAKAEGIENKNSFKNPLRKRRCLVLADGFYEWKKTDKKSKIPYFIRLSSGEPFAFAGLWDIWTKGEEPLTTFTIITTDNNELLKPIHNQMPVILHQKDEGTWLDPELKDPEKLKPLLKPYPSKEMEMYEVSTIVNSPKNDIPECVKCVT
ncbi:MAG: SOS response-associated peptidase [Deltaproteobacteria bacterium]